MEVKLIWSINCRGTRETNVAARWCVHCCGHRCLRKVAVIEIKINIDYKLNCEHSQSFRLAIYSYFIIGQWHLNVT